MSILSLVSELNERAPATYAIVGVPAIVDGLIEQIPEAFRLSDASERARASNMLSPGACGVLLSYARDASINAVRERSPKRVEDGLVALALQNGNPDVRDSIVALAMLFRSSQILDMDSTRLFEQASNVIANPVLQAQVRGFPLRAEKDRDLAKAFFIAERMTKDGFTYEWQSEMFARTARRASRKAWLRKIFGAA